MKDESSLDSAGPLTIAALVAVVVAIASWIMVDGNGSWGHPSPQTLAAAPEVPALPSVAASPPGDAP